MACGCRPQLFAALRGSGGRNTLKINIRSTIQSHCVLSLKQKETAVWFASSISYVVAYRTGFS